MEKLLSIIVLNYNRVNYSKMTINRLIEATTVPHEFLFVDNNSSDGTKGFLRGISKKTKASNVELVFNNKNLGVGGGRNEGLLRANGDYLMTIDDDIWVPDNYDKMLVNACNRIPNLGLTGISIEKHKYGMRTINGVKMQVKKGNLNGGCLCRPRWAFERLGYFMSSTVYGLEDCDIYNRTKMAGYLCMYIEKNGRHMDKSENKSYVAVKRRAHKYGSKQYEKMSKNIKLYKRGHFYVHYDRPDNLKTKQIDNAIKNKGKK